MNSNLISYYAFLSDVRESLTTVMEKRKQAGMLSNVFDVKDFMAYL